MVTIWKHQFKRFSGRKWQQHLYNTYHTMDLEHEILDKKKYQCTYCPKIYSQQGHLRTHNRIHTGEKPFKCTECDDCFAYSCILKKHLLIHTGERSFKCEQCGKRFSQQPHLKSHERVHMKGLTWGLTQEKSLIIAKSVTRAFQLQVTSHCMTGRIPEKSHMDAQNAKKYSLPHPA